MTAPIETPVETPKAPPMAEDQSSWEKFTPEMRDHAMREGELPPVETPKEPVREKPKEEPPEETPSESPAKAEEPQETPPEEEPVKPEAEPPKEEPPKRLFAGQYETVKELEKAVDEKQGIIERQSGELGDLRKEVQPKPAPEPEDPEPVRDQFDETSLKAHDEWLLREIDRRNKASEDRVTQGLRQYDMAQPVRKMIEQFADDHKDISPEKRLTIGHHADNMARAAGKPVSLDEAYVDLFGAKTETPSKPGETPIDDGKAAAIVEASKAPVTVADVPTSSPPPGEGTKGEVTSQAQWNALTETEREERKKNIGMPPKE